MKDIKLVDEQGLEIGRISNWDPAGQVSTPVHQIEGKELDFTQKTEYTLTISRSWVSPHLENMFSKYRLKYDTWRDENLWTAIGPDGRIGPDYATPEEALAAFPLKEPVLVNQTIDSGITFWAVVELEVLQGILNPGKNKGDPDEPK